MKISTQQWVMPLVRVKLYTSKLGKPPLIYLIYGLISWLFGPQLWPLRFLNTLLALLGSFSFFKILPFFGISLKVSKIATVSYVLLSTMVFEGTIFNAENIFVPLILVGFWQILESRRFNFQKNSNCKTWNSPLEILSVEKTSKSTSVNYKLILGASFWSLAILVKVHALVEISVLLLALVVVLIK